jgi:hypothetical protein
MAKSGHAPEITTHISSKDSKPNIFSEEGKYGVHPKTDGHGFGPENSGKPCRQEKMDK